MMIRNLYQQIKMKLVSYVVFLTLSLFGLKIFSQEILPVHQDYLSDNIYLVHPAAAGIGETGKIRAAIRMEGFGVANSPQIQTVNLHGKFGASSKAAFGITLVNNVSDQINTHKALQLTYAYHLDLDQTENFEQLSFGFSVAGIQSEVGFQNNFSNINATQIIQPLFYLNAAVGASYHLNGLSTFLTVKNIYTSTQNELFSSANNLNLRNYIFGAAYFFGNKKVAQYEPSVLIQYKDETNEKIVDINIKAYKNFTNAQVWGALSFRKSYDSSFYRDSKYISAIVGVNFNKMMFGYTYTKQLDEIVFGGGVFHQISIGFNVLPGDLKLAANPNINGIMF